MPSVQSSIAGAAEDSLPDRLLSENEFRHTVATFLDGPVASGYAVRLSVFAVNGGALLAAYESGLPPNTNPSQTRTLFEDEVRAVTCLCELWRSGGGEARADANLLVDKIAAIVDRHWGDRDPATMLPYLKSPTGSARFAGAARQLAATGRPIAVLHTDLDHFKNVNDEYGEKVGDSTLREFADRFRQAFQDIGVTVRTGGEEFSALLHCDDVGAVLHAVDNFRRRMESEPIAAIQRVNTCSIGLCLYPDADKFGDAEHPDAVLSDARPAERRAKDEGRNRIALVGPAPSTSAAAAVSLDDLRKAALAARAPMRVGKGVKDAFDAAVRDRLLQVISGTGNIQAAIGKVRSELSLLIGSFAVESDRPAELLGIMESLQWASTVVGALLDATCVHGAPLASGDRLFLVADDSGALTLEVSGTQIPLGCVVNAPTPLRAAIGAPRYNAGAEPSGGVGRLPMSGSSSDHDPLSPILLLPIGDQAKVAADGLRHLVAAVVDVDDRPTRGGGLPDFWQSNFSRVIRACLANPNIGAVVAVGDVVNARLTMERLNAASAADLGKLQRRLSMRADEWDAFVGRALTISSVAATREAVLAAIEHAVESMTPMDFSNRPAIDQGARTRRRLQIGAPDETHRLAITDGLRTRTMADAYPEALQLIRSAQDALDQVEPGRGTFREMTGFKLVLTDPLAERVPDYWHEDRDLLDAYYVQSFGSIDGLFGSRLLRSFGDDERSMVDFAACQAAEAASRRIPTRRINIPIVPDTLEHPLGLSSIQVMPRIRAAGVLLDVVFVWRTVDALVGLPFSAYGSIRWAEEFLVKVNGELSRRGGGELLRMGTLTYIALSFHMYLHDGDVEIARTIVQDASL